MEKSADAFRTISEVAEDLDLPQHVLRFWETRFTQIKPLKRGGGRRYYRPEDVDLLRAIRHLLYGEGYTIKGVQRILKEHGPRAVAQMALTQMRPQAEPAPTLAKAPLAAPPPPAGPSRAEPSRAEPSHAEPFWPPGPTTPAASPGPPPAPVLRRKPSFGPAATSAPDLAPENGLAPAPGRIAAPASAALRALEGPRQEAFDLDAPTTSLTPPRFVPVIEPPAPPRLVVEAEPARAPASLLDAARDALRPPASHAPEPPRAAEPPRAPEPVIPLVDPPRARFLAPAEPRFAPAPAIGVQGIGAQEIERLKAALYELSECERILAAVRGA
jgi:DNA-binding transcriptional MerR regulator